MEKEKTVRRSFFNKLLSTAVLGGLASFILGHKVEKVSGLSGSGSAGQIAYWTSSSNIGGNNALRWDPTNKNINFGSIYNSITSGVAGGTISGGGSSGYPNMVRGSSGSIGGGVGNRAGGDASEPYATVGGGFDNTASGFYSTVSGGLINTASGSTSTVAGGYRNTAAGDYSFAAGRKANIDSAHDGAFLFADDNDYDFNSAAANEFAVRCTGGARFVTAIDGSGNPTQTMALSSSGYLGVGTTSPARSIHLKGSNAVFRMDRDVNSAAFILHRTSPGFSSPWKTFYVGVDASGVNNGEFFIGDVGANVSGPSTKRLWIDNGGQVHIPNLGTGDINFANGVVATEEGDGLAFVNRKGKKIAVLDDEGNFHIKGKVMEDL